MKVTFYIFDTEVQSSAKEYSGVTDDLHASVSYLLEDIERLPGVCCTTQPVYILCTQNRLLDEDG